MTSIEHRETIERAALGRTALLGELYDARTEQFCSIYVFKHTPPTASIETTDIHEDKCTISYSDSLETKLKSTGMDGQLKMSFLAGNISCEGQAKYLNEEKTTTRASTGTFTRHIKTVNEKLNILHKDLHDCYTLKALETSTATHVVVEIDWGANFTIALKNEKSDSEQTNNMNAKGKLQANLKEVLGSFASWVGEVGGSAKVEMKDEKKIDTSHVEVAIYADTKPTEEHLPTTVPEAIHFMKQLPKLMKNDNKDKGRPLNYRMLPINVLENCIEWKMTTKSKRSVASIPIQQIDEATVNSFVRLFDDIGQMKARLGDMKSDAKTYEEYLKQNDIDAIRKLSEEIENVEGELRTKLAKNIVEYRNGRIRNLSEFRDTYRSHTKQLLHRINDDNQIGDMNRKIEMIELMKRYNIYYLSKNASLNSLKFDQNQLYVLYYDYRKISYNQAQWQHCLNNFINMAKKQKKPSNGNSSAMTFAVVDVDLSPHIAIDEGVQVNGDGPRICEINQGEYTSRNYRPYPPPSNGYFV